MSNNDIVLAEFKKLKNLYDSNNFVIDKSGVKIVELINTTMKLSPKNPLIDIGFKRSNMSYINKELIWYLSKSLNVYPQMANVKIWTQVCDADGFINSNYGWCVFDKDNYSQYEYALKELESNKDSRRSIIMYNRPSMTEEFNKNGRSDYLCTIYTSLFIRENKLIYNIHQRSCDFIFGFFNDFAWHCFVYDKLLQDLKQTYPDLQMGLINYNFDSLHVYERHFKFFNEII